MKTLQDIIDSLSPEEAEKHKDLISECQSRQNEIESCSVEIKANIERFTNITLDIFSNIEKIKVETENLNKNLTDYRNLSILITTKSGGNYDN